MAGYEVPAERRRVEIRVSNSRFISTITPADSVAEAQAFLREIRAEMPKATHHVYAFRIGHGNSITEGMSDDGEPSGTAGPPAMAVVRGSGLGDVALVITRFFGGTKLGTGGLVSAYTKAAQAAFDGLETEAKVIRLTCEVRMHYALLEQVRIMLREHEAIVEGESYEADVTIALLIAEDQFQPLADRIRDLTAGQSELSVVG